MKAVTFYKPNASNKGSAAQFQFGLSPTDDGLYVSIVKQASWDDKTKKGSFTANSKDPNKSKKIKLNASEASAICRVLKDHNTKWSTVHKNKEGKVTSISFSHYVKDNVKMGYGFGVGAKDGESFLLSLTCDEGYTLGVFLEEYIKNTFEKSNGNA